MANQRETTKRHANPNQRGDKDESEKPRNQQQGEDQQPWPAGQRSWWRARQLGRKSEARIRGWPQGRQILDGKCPAGLYLSDEPLTRETSHGLLLKGY